MSNKEQKFVLSIDATGSQESSSSKMNLTIQSDCTRGFMVSSLSQLFARDEDIAVAAKLALIALECDEIELGEEIDLTLNK
jgi:hypothetical protein